MKQLIMDVLEDMSGGQVNLASEAARRTVATTITAALKTKGSYEEYTEYELEEQEARKAWVCNLCGENTFEVDYDYLGSGYNHLGCELKEEMKEKFIEESNKNPVPKQHERIRREKNLSQKKHEEKVDWFDDKTMSSLTRTSDRRESDRREKNWSQKKHEEKVFGEYAEDIDEQAYAQGRKSSYKK
jgi:hypothetical protein